MEDIMSVKLICIAGYAKIQLNSSNSFSTIINCGQACPDYDTFDTADGAVSHCVKELLYAMAKAKTAQDSLAVAVSNLPAGITAVFG